MARARARDFALTSCPIYSLPDHNNSLRLSRPARSLPKPPLFFATFQFLPPTLTFPRYLVFLDIYHKPLSQAYTIVTLTQPHHPYTPTLLLSLTVVSGTHTPRAPIITCSRHPTGLAHSPSLLIKGTSVTMASNATPSQHGSLALGPRVLPTRAR